MKTAGKWDNKKRMLRLLEEAFLTGESPESPAGQKIAGLHRQWCFFGSEEYKPGKHAGIAELYITDERFTSYYEGDVEGCALFLHDAIVAYTK